MAIGVDSSKWKPRKAKGTPAAKVCNLIGFSLISFGVIIGAVYQYSGVTERFRKKLGLFYEDPEPEVERKQMIASGFPNRSGNMIRKLMKEAERTDLPDK